MSSSCLPNALRLYFHFLSPCRLFFTSGSVVGANHSTPLLVDFSVSSDMLLPLRIAHMACLRHVCCARNATQLEPLTLFHSTGTSSSATPHWLCFSLPTPQMRPTFAKHGAYQSLALQPPLSSQGVNHNSPPAPTLRPSPRRLALHYRAGHG